MDTARVSVETRANSDYINVQPPSETGHLLTPVAENSEKQEYTNAPSTNGTGPVPEITVTNTTPTPGLDGDGVFGLGKRSGSIDHESTKGKKVQAMLHKSQAAASRIGTISKKIGSGMVRRDSMSSLKRSASAPGEFPFALTFFWH